MNNNTMNGEEEMVISKKGDKGEGEGEGENEGEGEGESEGEGEGEINSTNF